MSRGFWKSLFTSCGLRASALSCSTSSVCRYSGGNIWFMDTRPWPSLIYRPPFFRHPVKMCSAARWCTGFIWLAYSSDSCYWWGIYVLKLTSCIGIEIWDYKKFISKSFVIHHPCPIMTTCNPVISQLLCKMTCKVNVGKKYCCNRENTNSKSFVNIIIKSFSRRAFPA